MVAGPLKFPTTLNISSALLLVLIRCLLIHASQISNRREYRRHHPALDCLSAHREPGLARARQLKLSHCWTQLYRRVFGHLVVA